MEEYCCRVCGLYSETKPWGEDGKCPTYEICPCCGVEFGYEDYTVESTIRYRKQWIENGAKWSDSKEKPEHWSYEEQIKNIPSKYR